MKNHPAPARRDFLKLAGGAGLSAALGPWAQLQALAQTTQGSDYKALVCLFMFGGNDGNNLVVPTDAARYAQYQRARPNLALAQGQLLPLTLSNATGGSYGLHPAMAGIQQLINGGNASVVANVGPLMVPTTKAQWSARAVPLPDNLYSHSDQQGAWQSAIVDAPPRTGWGGRLLERLVDEGAGNRGYSAISVSGGNVWQAGDRSLTPYRVSSSGDFGFDFYKPQGTDPMSVAISELLREQRADPFEQAWLQVMGRSIDNQRILTDALSSNAVTTAFPDTGMGRQLRMIARLISARAKLGLSRQCFFCSIGGFDTHGDDQLQRQAENFGEISAAVAAFHAATVELGLAKQVTLFTASDFGRTFQSNGGGTDHAWGNHHLVVGGGVRGGRLVGPFPELVVGGADDVGQGVWIPGVATDQMGGELARWFGADSAVMDAAFPRLRYFDANLGLMG
jgi:uncharacterized protein (DUF1501 family)